MSTARERLDAWLNESAEVLDIGGAEGDAMRCRPAGGEPLGDECEYDDCDDAGMTPPLPAGMRYFDFTVFAGDLPPLTFPPLAAPRGGIRYVLPSGRHLPSPILDAALARPGDTPYRGS